MVPFFPFIVLFKSTHIVEKYEYCIFWYSSIHQSYNKSTVLIATTIVIQYERRTRRGRNNNNSHLQNLGIYLRCESTNEGRNGSTVPATETTKQTWYPKSGGKGAGLQYHLLTELFSNWWVTCQTGWLLLPQPPRAHARPTLMTTYISVSSYAQPCRGVLIVVVVAVTVIVLIATYLRLRVIMTMTKRVILILTTIPIVAISWRAMTTSVLGRVVILASNTSTTTTTILLPKKMHYIIIERHNNNNNNNNSVMIDVKGDEMNHAHSPIW